MIKGRTETITVVSATDFSTEALQYLIVTASGAIAANSNTAAGVGVDRVRSGEHMTLDWSGHMKARAGAAVVLNVGVKVTTSGYLINVTSGDGNVPVGMPLVAVASGDMFEFTGNFANARAEVA